jgi:hypothetical protein
LPITQVSVTPSDLFAFSTIRDAEIALTLSGTNLHVFSDGRAGAVTPPDGHVCVAHTHPTGSHEKRQVDGDISKAKRGKAEIMTAKFGSKYDDAWDTKWKINCALGVARFYLFTGSI